MVLQRGHPSANVPLTYLLHDITCIIYILCQSMYKCLYPLFIIFHVDQNVLTGRVTHRTSDPLSDMFVCSAEIQSIVFSGESY